MGKGRSCACTDGWTDSNISENHTQLKKNIVRFRFFLHPLGSLPKLDRFSCKDPWQEWLQALWIKPVMPKCCVGWWLDWIGWGMIRLMDFMKFPTLLMSDAYLTWCQMPVLSTVQHGERQWSIILHITILHVSLMWDQSKITIWLVV